MKKIAKLMTVLAVAAFTFASCEDVPNPFGPVTPPTTDGDDTNTELPYTSVNLNTGWSLEAVSADQPWSMGTSYVQATGYQKWDGAETKTNRAVEAWLVSPAFSTKGYENVKIWFDQTIKYATYTGWEANHKIYVSSNYNESDFSAATWEEVTDFKPEASKFSDWTLYSSGELQLPASMVGQEAIYIAFYFKAPADKSTTWELKNFNIAEGIADNTGGSDTPDVDPDAGTEGKPYDVASAIAAGDKTGVFVKGYIVGTAYSNQETKQTEWNFGTTNAQASNLLLAATATETDYTKCMPVALPSGSAIRTSLNIKDNPGNLGKEVLLYGNLTKYFSQPGMKETSYAVLDGTAIGTKPGGGDTPSGEAKGSGTQADPFNIVAVAQEAAKLAAGETSATDVYFKGKICSIKYTFNADKGTATFNVSDDGNTGGTEFLCYSVYTLGNQPWVEGNTQIAVGDNVVICGKLTNYNGTLETASKKAYIYSLNESGSGGDASFSAGKYFITYKSGDTYYVAKPLDEAAVTKGYGYSYCAETTATDGKLNNVDASNLFTFTAITGGFSIQDANNVYYYTNAKNKSFQVSTTAPTDFYWTVTLGAGGTAKINSSAKAEFNIVHTLYNTTHEFIPSDTGDEIILATEDGTLLK